MLFRAIQRRQSLQSTVNEVGTTSTSSKFKEWDDVEVVPTSELLTGLNRAEIQRRVQVQVERTLLRR